MDPLLAHANNFRRKGIPSLSLVAGIVIGIFLYMNLGFLLPQEARSREVTPRGDLTSDEKSTIEIFENAAPSVVFITAKTRQNSWFLSRSGSQDVPSGTGSGFIWDESGHIVTNFHVIQSGTAFEVVLYDQSAYDAQVVGYYPDKDLAVLKIDAPANKLRPMPVGTTKNMKVGQKVLAIGNPFGLDHTLTTGVVSALNRTLESVNKREIQGAIQTDAAINPGNSGGPLLDSAGRLIGVNTQIYSTSGSSAGIGFAIPVDTVNEVVPQLVKFGKVIRPGLGIYAHPQNQRIMRYLRVNGLLIRDVQPGSSADKAGLRGVRSRRDGSYELGDIITKVDDKPIHSVEELGNVMDFYKIGDKVQITYIRDGRAQKTTLELQAIN